MQAIFMARGPSFQEKIQIDSINNVDIYHIACRILELEPNPHATAGSLTNLTHLFRTAAVIPPNNSASLYLTSSFSVLMMMVLLSFNFEMMF